MNEKHLYAPLLDFHDMAELPAFEADMEPEMELMMPTRKWRSWIVRGVVDFWVCVAGYVLWRLW